MSFAKRTSFRKTLHGPTHPRTLQTLNNLAVAYQDDGRLRDANALFELTRDVQMKSPEFGPDHPSTLNTLNNLGAAYADDDRTESAIRLREKVRDASAKALGPEHPITLKTLNNIADTHSKIKHFDDAIAISRRFAMCRFYRRITACAIARHCGR